MGEDHCDGKEDREEEEVHGSVGIRSVPSGTVSLEMQHWNLIMIWVCV